MIVNIVFPPPSVVESLRLFSVGSPSVYGSCMLLLVLLLHGGVHVRKMQPEQVGKHTIIRFIIYYLVAQNLK